MFNEFYGVPMVAGMRGPVTMAAMTFRMTASAVSLVHAVMMRRPGMVTIPFMPG